jgi:hypothetical protein
MEASPRWRSRDYCSPSHQIEREKVPKDFWRHATLQVERDNRTLWKVIIRPCNGVSPAIEQQIQQLDYVEPEAKWSDVKRLWPQKDRRTDRCDQDVETEEARMKNPPMVVRIECWGSIARTVITFGENARTQREGALARRGSIAAGRVLGDCGPRCGVVAAHSLRSMCAVVRLHLPVLWRFHGLALVSTHDFQFRRARRLP